MRASTTTDGSRTGREKQRGAAALKAVLSPGQLLTAAARRRVLDYLAEHGPAHVADIPRAWPVTGPFIRWALRDLVEEGAVRWVGLRDPRRVTLTASGVRMKLQEGGPPPTR